MTELRERRAVLLMESELNRQALRIETARMQLSIDRFRDGFASGHGLWKWLAPVAGFVLARKLGKSSAVAKGSAVLAIGRAVWSAWRHRRQRAADVPPGG